MSDDSAAAMRRNRSHRVIRKLHLWIGAWGAIAAVLYGATGFVLNHRGVLKLPQGDSTEVARLELPVPEAARNSQQALQAWLEGTRQQKFDVQRGPPGRGEARGESRGDSRGETRGDEGAGRLASRWVFSTGNARVTTRAEYTQGAETLSLRTVTQSPLAVMSRLHKGAGSGIAWMLLSDSFAIGMVALGISGLLLWARGRSARQMIFSVVGVAVIVVAMIAGGAIL